MILTDQMLIDAVKDRKVIIEPFERKQIQPASYDLRLGSCVTASSSQGRVNIEERAFLEILPGDFSVVVTNETITLDNQHAGRFGLCSKWARQGLFATTGPQVDPGFEGRLIIGLANLSRNNIVVKNTESFLTLELHRLSESVNTVYYGPHQNQNAISEGDREAVGGYELIPFFSEMNIALRSLSSKVRSLEKPTP